MESIDITSVGVTHTSRASQDSSDAPNLPVLAQLGNGQADHMTDGDGVFALPLQRRKPRRSKYELMKNVRICLAFIGILGIVAVIFVLSFYLPEEETNTKQKEDQVYHNVRIKLGSMEFESNTLTISVNNSLGTTVVSVQVAQDSKTGQAQTTVLSKDTAKMEIKIGNLRLTVEIVLKDKCWKISSSSNSTSIFQDCIDISDSNWYGGGELYEQMWPIEKGTVSMTPFVSTNLQAGNRPGQSFGGVLEPYFFNSIGGGIYVDRSVPLHVGINSPEKGKLCLKSQPYESFRGGTKQQHPHLSYTICTSSNVRDVHNLMVQRFIKPPLGVPDFKMLTIPIWSTWARYKKAINQSIILNFAREIVHHNMTASHLEIGEKYSTTYGDFNFNGTIFPDAIKMITDLKTLGFRVSLWMHPFADIGSYIFSQGVPYWVRVRTNELVPGIVKWRNGYAALFDPTNPKGVTWFQDRLRAFKKKFDIDSFKFDAGEVSYIPRDCTFNTPQENINNFGTNYVKMVSELGGMVEVGVGYHSQEFPVFVRIFERSSRWSIKNGLKSVLTATLTFGVLGYPFVLPGTVGGNVKKGIPEKELYIRWAQLSVFLPAIQFSVTPWDYDQETVQLVKEALHIRETLAPQLVKFAKTASNGVPIIKPLWWYAPSDKKALEDDSEFMLGNKFLIAPVLEQGATSRAVYLPSGLWREMFRTKEIVDSRPSGKSVIYNVSLKDILYFELISPG